MIHFYVIGYYYLVSIFTLNPLHCNVFTFLREQNVNEIKRLASYTDSKREKKKEQKYVVPKTITGRDVRCDHRIYNPLN